MAHTADGNNRKSTFKSTFWSLGDTSGVKGLKVCLFAADSEREDFPLRSQKTGKMVVLSEKPQCAFLLSDCEALWILQREAVRTGRTPRSRFCEAASHRPQPLCQTERVDERLFPPSKGGYFPDFDFLSSAVNAAVSLIHSAETRTGLQEDRHPNENSSRKKWNEANDGPKTDSVCPEEN